MGMYRRGIAVLITAAISLTACSVGDKPAPTPSTITSASATPDTTTDIVIRDTSFRQVMRTASKTTGIEAVARFIPKGQKERCTLLGNEFIVKGGETLMVHCGEGYVVMPEAIQTDPKWSIKDPMGIWYEVALDAVRIDASYSSDVLGASCAAAYVTTRKAGYQRKADGETLLSYLTAADYGNNAIYFAHKGLDMAEANKPINGCKNA